jgi:tetratricopeptide (TPR) repeat protein
MQNWSRLFPNAKEEVAPAPTVRIEQIKAMHDSGEVEAAIAAIEQIGPDSQEYLEARRLLSRWRDEVAASAEPVPALSGDDVTRHDTLVADARRAYDSANYLDAARAFTRASDLAPLAASEAALFDDAKRQLEPIAQQIDLYKQRQWELVLPPLWRRLEQSPRDKDVHQLLVNSYFNLTVRELRRGDVAKAAEYLEEAATLDRDDAELLRLEELVTTYSSLPRDLLFEIYVQHLDFRN